MSKRKLAIISTIIVICFIFTFNCTGCTLKKDGEDLKNNGKETFDPNKEGIPDGAKNGGDTGLPDVSTEENQGNNTNHIEGSNSDNLSQDTRDKDGTSGDTASLEIWTGDYSFSEFAPPDQNMFYTITIFEENSAYYADIYIEGFQAMTGLRARVTGNIDSIMLTFDKYLPDNLFEPYNEGDLLLSLERSDSKVLTYWTAIKPMLLDNDLPGGECFQKIEYPILIMVLNDNFGMEYSYEVTELTEDTVTYSYYDYNDADSLVHREKTVPFSEMLAKEDDGFDKYYISMFLFNGDNIRELELTEKLENRIKSDPEFRKKLGSYVGKHFDKALVNDVIDVCDIE